MGLTGTYGAVSRADARRVLDRALDLGISHIDTAASYGDGANETLVGEAIASRRDAVVIATKCGVRWDGGRLRRDGAHAAIHAGVRESLGRLGVDHIDLVYLHRVDPEVPVEESVGALQRLRERGDISAIGLSEASAAQIRRAAAVTEIAALQSEYSLMTRDLEREVIPLLVELGIVLVAYAPLGRGLLTGRRVALDSLAADDFRRRVPRFHERNLPGNLSRTAVLDEIARERGVRPAQVALAWLLARDHDVIPIPGTTRLEAVDENAAAGRLALGSYDLARLSDGFPLGVALGERGPSAEGGADGSASENDRSRQP